MNNLNKYESKKERKNKLMKSKPRKKGRTITNKLRSKGGKKGRKKEESR